MTRPGPMTGRYCREIHIMGSREDSLRGRVRSEWKQRPGQDKERVSQLTVTACIEADVKLEAEGLNPAPQFRQGRKTNDCQYIRAWVLGCHFRWLNPR
jgi:hypothetical protein